MAKKAATPPLPALQTTQHAPFDLLIGVMASAATVFVGLLVYQKWSSHSSSGLQSIVFGLMVLVVFSCCLLCVLSGWFYANKLSVQHRVSLMILCGFLLVSSLLDSITFTDSNESEVIGFTYTLKKDTFLFIITIALWAVVQVLAIWVCQNKLKAPRSP